MPVARIARDGNDAAAVIADMHNASALSKDVKSPLFILRDIHVGDPSKSSYGKGRARANAATDQNTHITATRPLRALEVTCGRQSPTYKILKKKKPAGSRLL